MTSVKTEEPTSDGQGPVATKAAAEDVNTSELELIETTPTPMVLPLSAAEVAALSPLAEDGQGKRPPPLPRKAATPPPPPRGTQTRAAVPPPPPGAHLEDTPETPVPEPVASPPPSPPPARITGAYAVPAARRSPAPEAPPPPPRRTQTRPMIQPAAPPRRSPSPDGPPVAPVPPIVAPSTAAASSSRISAAHPSAPPPLPAAVSSPTLTAQTVPMPAVAAPEPRTAVVEQFVADAAIADARRRVEQAVNGERTALARARTELGILLEVAAGDATAALTEYRAAHGVAAHLAAPITAARRLTPARPAAPLIALVEAEARATNEPAARLTRQLELGLLLAASGAPAERTCQAFREVLAARPSHPGALRGLEAALRPSVRIAETPQQMEALAAHLETMAVVFASDVQLSAWLQVERGQLLERLGRAEAARAAFETALALDGDIGPVRDAYTRHLLVQGQIEALVEAWAAEANLESDGARAARLCYFAGRLAAERLDQKPQAIQLYERAASNAVAAPSIRRAALRELLPLYEAVSNLDLAVATGGKLLITASDAERAYWHRRLVPLCEALGQHAEMAGHAHQVLAVEPDDEPMRDKLDRALAALGQHAERVAMLTEQAAQASTPTARIDLLLRAARIAEHDLGRSDLALLSLRSAWAIEPGNADVCDGIVRLLTPGTPPSPADPDDPARVRARINFYIEAAAAAADPTRKIAFLEKLAQVWEDEVRAPDRALAVFAEVLAIEPKRRSAILGLARCAGRAGNARELLRALVLEAEQADDVLLERSLLLRAADVASRQLGEHDTALDLVKRVLTRTGGDAAALRAAFRIHERAGRQAEALGHLRVLLGQSKKGPAGYPIQAEIARFLEERMHRAADALTAWREAHRMDPANPTPRAEIRRILLCNGDHRAVAEELAALGVATSQPAERGELLLEAAEIYDDRLGDAERALPLLVDARACLPDEVAIVERLDRAYLRTNKKSERLALLHATESPDPRCQLAIASLQAEDRDPSKAAKRLADLSGNTIASVAALRILEHAMRRAERWHDLAAVLRRQGECFATPETKLGSVYELIALEEYGEVRTSDGQPTACELLARLAPDDLLPHELGLKRSGLAVANEAPVAPRAASLATLAAAAPDPWTAASLQLAAGLLLEQGDEAHADKEALVAYAIALGSWPDCLTAARGARRMALRLGETPTFVEAATALGSLELDPAIRCERLLEAAAALPDGPQAFALVCQALVEDPNSNRATDALIAAVGQGQDAGKAGETLRTALERALAPDHLAKLGAALAHVAVARLGDHTVAIEALRRVRKRAPKHVGNLLALADVSTGLGLHAEAVEAASSAMGLAHEPSERLRATVILAEVHLRSPAFRDTARREAGEAEKLAEQAGTGNGDLLGRLGAVYRQLGDEDSAERVLIAALTLGSESSATLSTLVSMYGTGVAAGERVAAALHKVIAHAEASGRPRCAEWLAALGRVEATMLGMKREGLGRLREAAIMAPARVATYQALVEAHGGAHDEAVRDLAAMLPAFGAAAPTAPQITELLALLLHEARLGKRPCLAEAAEALLALVGKQDAAPSRATLPLAAPAPASLDRETLLSSLLADAAQAPLVDVAALVREPLTKLLRTEPDALGVATRDRLTARSSHPVRVLADRVAAGFGNLRFDLYLEANTTTGRLLVGDPPALVLPAGFEALPELEQAAGLARLLTYVALDIPWVEEQTADDADGILFGALRVGMDLWGQGDLSPAAEAGARVWRQRIAKVAGRRTKRALEEQAPKIRAQADTTAWREALRIVSLRAAYVLTGSLPAPLGLATRLDAELANSVGSTLAVKLFKKPITRELIVFALSEKSEGLRRIAGTA